MKKTPTAKSLKREAFPSSSELIVASALLLLSTTPTNGRKKSSRVKLKAIANFVELKSMKVTRKKRTKTYCDRVSPSDSGSTTSALSCLTNNSCVEVSVQSNVGLGKTKSLPKRKVDKVIKGDVSNMIGSGHIRRRAEGILKMLATCGSASEVRIREVLGNSPDTSKALRILLRRAQVKRHGAGGRVDPYTYSIA